MVLTTTVGSFYQQLMFLYNIFAGMSSNHDGALLYFVKTDCRGSGDTGHCPPYDEDKQLTCVVCTRMFLLCCEKLCPLNR